MISRIIKDETVRRLRHLIADAGKIAIICHVGPDGDAVGSSLALAHVLGALGKEARCIIPDATSSLLMQLPEAKELVDACKHPDFARTLLREADLIFCLDFNDPKRVDRMADALLAARASKVMIDHHENPVDFTTIAISQPEMAATCYVLFRVLCRLELLPYIDSVASTLMLAGILTDTGGFAYNSSDPELFEVVAELLRHGADKDGLIRLLFNTVSENALRLNAYAMDRKLEVDRGMGAALITLSRAELNRYHYCKGDTESLVNKPLAIPGVVYSCFMREEEKYIKVSMRSKGDFPVNEICAEHFGGGGHLNAAGGEFHGTLEEAAEAFRALMAENKKKYINKKTMRIFRKMALAAIAFAGVALASCEDTKSYAELLTDETHYVNAYLANHRVVAEIPADTVFETGEDAPYYRLDEDGNMYMQVLDAGTKGNKVKADEQIYFRFTRWSLYNYSGGELSGGAGNENDLSFANTWFRYGNYQLQTSSQWGSGIQYPLSLLPVDCEVNIVIKSQLGLTSEIAEVVPFLYHIRYYRPKI